MLTPNHFALAVLSAALAQGAIAQNKTTRAERNLVIEAKAAPAPAISTQRIALVIGNSAYKEAPLLNPINDARAIAQALKESGFVVILRENTDRAAMMAALREFGDRIRAGGTGLFYYAGHGMQIKGRNYLIPVGASIDREDEVAYSAVDAQSVLDKMEAAGNPSNIMILDACRNNPFTRSTRSGQAGLAQMDAPVGTLVAYATSPGAVASDGTGRNGLYTQHLLTAIRQPNSKVEDVFKQVRANVRRDSQGKQVPWESTSLEGDFYFQGGAVAAPVATAQDPTAVLEQLLWDAVKDSKEPVELRVYLNRYPGGKYAKDARTRLGQLQAATPLTPPTAAPSAAQVATLAAPVAPSAPAALASGKPVLSPAIAPTRPPLPAAELRHSQEEQNAAVDRRTEELLASLADSKPAAAKPAGTANSRGFEVGDRWRFQTVDKFKKEVVRNWGRSVTNLRSGGAMVMNDGTVQALADGTERVRDANDGYRQEFTEGVRYFPSSWTVGHSEKAQYKKIWKEPTRSGVEAFDVTIKVLSRETVKVPAGEFETLKVQITGFIQSQLDGDARTSAGTFTEVYWYAPAVHYFVAVDYERRWGGNIDKLERHELTSFTLRSPGALAAR